MTDRAVAEFRAWKMADWKMTDKLVVVITIIIIITIIFFIFTARRYASAVYAVALCLSVSVPVTSRCSNKNG